MDFSWTTEQDALYKNILASSQEKLVTRNLETPWTDAEWRLCGEIGLLGLCAPERYGGSGFGSLTTARAMEAFGRGCEDMGLVFSAAAHLFACVLPIVEYGSEEAKEILLPGLCSGASIAANAITEKNAGSDVFALKTRAIRDGDTYVLTGEKSFVSNGPAAHLFVIYASTNPSHGYMGISGFILERNTPGLTISEPFDKMGLSSTPACEIHLHECSVPISHRLGNEGQGAQIFQRSMQWERTCLFAAYLGQMERQLEQSITHAQKRYQFQAPIGKNQAIAHRLANMKVRLEAARLLLYRACWLIDHNMHTSLDISLAKLAISEAALQGGLDAIQIHGAAGFVRGAGIERMLRDAIPSTIFSGTSEIQRDIIARGLGL